MYTLCTTKSEIHVLNELPNIIITNEVTIQTTTCRLKRAFLLPKCKCKSHLSISNIFPAAEKLEISKLYVFVIDNNL